MKLCAKNFYCTNKKKIVKPCEQNTFALKAFSAEKKQCKNKINKIYSNQNTVLI
jgi:hypothetical protein